MSRSVRMLAGAAAAALAATAPAGAAVRITHVDTSSYPTIRATVVSSAGPAVVPAVTENGAPVVGLQSRNLGREKAVVLAVDVSRSMQGRPLADAIAAARGFIDAKPAADAVSIMSFGPQPTVLSTFSTATIDADAALRNMALASRTGTALYDAIELAANNLATSAYAGRV